MPLPSNSGISIDVRQEVETARLGPYHYFLAGIIALIVFFDGYDTFNAAYVIHYVAKPWHLTSSQAGLLVSSGLFGFTISAIFQGKFSDRHDRRKTILGALWMASIFSYATGAFARSLVTFCLFRFLTGIGLGILLPIGVTYINEFAPRRLKHAFSTWGWGLGFPRRDRRLHGGSLSDTGIWLALSFLCRFPLGIAGSVLPLWFAGVAAVFGRTRGHRLCRSGFGASEPCRRIALSRFRSAVRVPGVEGQSRLNVVAAIKALPQDDFGHLGCGVFCHVRDLRPDRLDTHGVDAAW